MRHTLRIDAGELNQRVTVQQRAAGDNGLGEGTGAWAALPGMPVWAKAQPLRGRDFFAASQLQATCDVRFILRWRAGITAAMRVLWNGEHYDIVGEPANVDGAGMWLEIMAITGVRDGR